MWWTRFFQRRRKQHDELAEQIRGFLSAPFPDVQVSVGPWEEDPSMPAISVTVPRFATLYPQQRFHWILAALPPGFLDKIQPQPIFFELAPGETPADAAWPNEERTSRITPEILRRLEDAGFFAALDNRMAPEAGAGEKVGCKGEFQLSKLLLREAGIDENQFLDVFDVLMSKGAYCDCEVLTNVAEQSRYKERIWTAVNADPRPMGEPSTR